MKIGGGKKGVAGVTLLTGLFLITTFALLVFYISPVSSTSSTKADSLIPDNSVGALISQKVVKRNISYTIGNIEQPFLVKNVTFNYDEETDILNYNVTIGYNSSYAKASYPSSPTLIYLEGNSGNITDITTEVPGVISLVTNSQVNETKGGKLRKLYNLSSSSIKTSWDTLKSLEYVINGTFKFNATNNDQTNLILGWGTGSTVVNWTASSSTIVGSGIIDVALYNTTYDSASTAWRTNKSLSFNELETNKSIDDRWFNSRKTATDYYDAGDSTQLEPGLGNLTIMGWFKTDASGSIGYITKGARTNGEGYTLYSSGDPTRRYKFYIGNGTVNTSVTFAVASNNVDWQHLAVVVNRTGNISLYLNNTLVNSTSAIPIENVSVTGGTQIFKVGNANEEGTANTFSFGGDIDEVYYYSRPLGSGEITTAYNDGKAHVPSTVSNTNLQLYLDFNGEAKDRSTNALTISSTGSPWFSGKNDDPTFPSTIYCVAESNGLTLIDALNNTFFMSTTSGKGWIPTSGSLDSCNAFEGLVATHDSGTGFMVMDLPSDKLYLFNTSGKNQYSTNVSRRDESDAYNAPAGGKLADNTINDVYCKKLSGYWYCALGSSNGIDILNMSSLTVLTNTTLETGANEIALDSNGDLYWATSGATNILARRTNVIGAASGWTQTDNVTLPTSPQDLEVGNNKVFLGLTSSGINVYNTTLANTINYTTSNVLLYTNNTDSLKMHSDNITLALTTTSCSTGTEKFCGIFEINTTANTRTTAITRNATVYTSISGSLGGWYRLEGDGNDTINSNNNLVNYTGGFIAGVIGNGLNLTSSTNLPRANLTYGSELDLGTQNFTIQFWYKEPQCGPCNYPAKSTLLYYGASGGGGNYSWIYVDSSDQLTYEQNVSGSIQKVNATNSFSSDAWNWGGIVRNGTTISIYRAGALSKTLNVTLANISYSVNWTVGARDDSVSPINGTLDELRIMVGTALNSSQMASDYAAYLPNSKTQLPGYGSLREIDVISNSPYISSATSSGLYLFRDSTSTDNLVSLSWSGTDVDADTTKPVITVTSPTNTTYIVANTSLNVSADETIDKWWYILNSGSNITFSPNTTFNAVAGQNNITIYANDTAGNLGNSSIIFFTFDNTPPIITYVSPTENNNAVLSRTYIQVNVTATDETGVSRINISLYNSTNNLINSSISSTSPLFVNFTGLSEGLYYFNVTANDTANNNATSATRNVTLDVTPPTINFVAPTPSNNTNLSQSYIDANITSTDPGSGITTSGLTIFLYNSAGSIVSQPTSSTSPFFNNFTGLADGTYYLNATAFDNALNENKTETRNITLDTVKPSVVLNSPGNNTQFNVSYVDIFNATVTDINGTGVRNVTIFINGVANQTNTSGISGDYKFNISFADGSYNWSILAYDNTLNSNMSLNRTFNVTTFSTTFSSESPLVTEIFIDNFYSIFVNVTVTGATQGTANYTIPFAESKIDNTTIVIKNSTGSTISHTLNYPSITFNATGTQSPYNITYNVKTIDSVLPPCPANYSSDTIYCTQATVLTDRISYSYIFGTNVTHGVGNATKNTYNISTSQLIQFADRNSLSIFADGNTTNISSNVVGSTLQFIVDTNFTGTEKSLLLGLHNLTVNYSIPRAAEQPGGGGVGPGTDQSGPISDPDITTYSADNTDELILDLGAQDPITLPINDAILLTLSPNAFPPPPGAPLPGLGATDGNHDNDFEDADDDYDGDGIINRLDLIPWGLPPVQVSLERGGGGTQKALAIVSVCGNDYCEPGEDALMCSADCGRKANVSFAVTPRIESRLFKAGLKEENKVTILNSEPVDVFVRVAFACLDGDISCKWFKFKDKPDQQTMVVRVPAGTQRSPGMKTVEYSVDVPSDIPKGWYKTNLVLINRDFRQVIPFEISPIEALGPFGVLYDIGSGFWNADLLKFDKEVPVLGSSLKGSFVIIIFIILTIVLFYIALTRRVFRK